MTATPDRCPRCDRDRCAWWTGCGREGCDGTGGCSSFNKCAAHAVDWRQRALDAEARADAAEASESYLRRAIHAEADYLGDLAETFGLGPTRAILVTAVDRLRRVAGDRAALKEPTP